MSAGDFSRMPSVGRDISGTSRGNGEERGNCVRKRGRRGKVPMLNDTVLGGVRGGARE